MRISVYPLSRDNSRFIGFPELLLLGLVVLLVFGPKRLPEMGRSMGKGLREFKDSISGGHHNVQESPLELPAGFHATVKDPSVVTHREHDSLV